jgi:hypothetical protein
MPEPLQIALLAASANNAVVNKYTPAGGLIPFFAYASPALVCVAINTYSTYRSSPGCSPS